MNILHIYTHDSSKYYLLLLFYIFANRLQFVVFVHLIMISRQCVCLHIIVYQDVQTHSNWCMNKTKTKKKKKIIILLICRNYLPKKLMYIRMHQSNISLKQTEVCYTVYKIYYTLYSIQCIVYIVYTLDRYYLIDSAL